MTSVADDLETIIDALVESYGRQKNPPSTLYHYTSAEALLPILTSGKMWASNIRFQNDPREMTYARDLLSDLMRSMNKSRGSLTMRRLIEEIDFEIIDTHFSVYVICFSEDGDLLSQWRAYGLNGSGFALGFDSTKIKRLSKQAVGLVAVEYNEKTQRSLLKTAFDELGLYAERKLRDINSTQKRKKFVTEAAKWFSAYMLFFLVIFKASGYREEKEWRYVDVRFVTEHRDIRIRHRHNLIIPYIEVCLAGETKPLPLREIITGPTRNHSLDTLAVPVLVSNTNLPPIDLKPSTLSYRP